MASTARVLKGIAVALLWIVGLFLVMQLVPYGRTHENPPVVEEPKWDSPRTRELAVRACFNCHSFETKWPWYSSVAPFSWVVEFDVNNARETVNFSDWTHKGDLAESSATSIVQGNMPPAKYKMAHPEANLTRDEMLELARGLDATMGVPKRL
jgi:Haem-binding domain